MARKYSLQVHIDPPLMAVLRAEAARRGVSLGEVVREALAAYLETHGGDRT